MVEKIHEKEVTLEENNKKQNLLFKMPKNIKQIGKTGQNPEIYIEDYAESYLKRLSECDYTECRAAVLVGEVVQMEKNRVIFIRGAIEAEGAVKDNELHFTQDIWNTIYEEMKTYFPNKEVVGWFLGGPGFLLEAEEMLLRTHLDQFAGKDRVFYKIDSIERETKFYLYEQSKLCARPGFFIYYEKNEEMQNYMLSRKASHGSEIGLEEPTLRELRQVLHKKQQEKEQQEQREIKKEVEKKIKKEGQTSSENKNISGITRLFYTTGALATFTLVLVGVAVLQNIEKIKKMQSTWKQTEEIVEQAPSISPPTPTQQTPIKQSENDIFSYLESQGVVLSTEEENSETIVLEDEEETSLLETMMTPTPIPGEAEQVLADNSITHAEDFIQYEVKKGDTLAGICYRMYGTVSRMEEIKALNQIANEDKIFSGQMLLLPQLEAQE